MAECERRRWIDPKCPGLCAPHGDAFRRLAYRSALPTMTTSGLCDRVPGSPLSVGADTYTHLLSPRLASFAPISNIGALLLLCGTTQLSTVRTGL